MTRSEGNVIHAEFGKKPAPRLPSMSFTCEILYADEFGRFIRMTYWINGVKHMQHIASGVGLDA